MAEKVKGNKMLQYVNWRMRIQISETRTLLGTFMAYDKHMNLVLGDCEEYRRVSRKKEKEGEKEEKRMLGLLLLRGENVISLSAETPPPPKPRAQLAVGVAPGVGKAAGRGMPAAPLAAAPKGLSGPVRGVGQVPASMMLPQSTTVKAPVSYARGTQLPGMAPPVIFPVRPGGVPMGHPGGLPMHMQGGPMGVPHLGGPPLAPPLPPHGAPMIRPPMGRPPPPAGFPAFGRPPMGPR